jgi:sulfite exporter TauE/SafE
VTPLAWSGIVLASAAGSVHCAAMCGGFVAAYTNGGEQRGVRLVAHLAYNAGRLVTYSVLGASAGALGSALDLAGRAAGVAHAAAIATAVLLLVSGAAGLAPRTRLVKLERRVPRPFTRRIAAVFAQFRDKPPVVRAALLGLSTTLLPCGWLYAFVALAAASGSAFEGALTLSAFWVGSVPVLLGVGVSLRALGQSAWGRLSRLRPSLVIAVGVITLFSRLQLPAFAASAQPAATAGDSAALPSSSDCACHRSRAGTPSVLGRKEPSPR